ncbi:PAS domain-containing protein [Mycolicibacterium litorale]|uniref:PAS domain-containing protein n=1 Tax=Mycolicibacterium litorale TaxID=758802 RepID=UPI003CF122DE
MSHDWLLVETLGSEPVVVARGGHTENMVPISAFLRRNPHLMAVQTAIAETVRTGQGLSSITPKNDRVIRTEVVQMSDGRIHGVHVWIGLPGMDPPERPLPGPLKWDLETGIATATTQSLANSGRDPDAEDTHGRSLAEDLPMRDLNPSETKVLSMAIRPEPGQTFCSTWDVTDHRGSMISVGFSARALLEAHDGGAPRLVCRAMNWRAERDGPVFPPDHLAQRILDGLAQSGLHRALVDFDTWKLLKWLDPPAPFYDWRANEVHPDDGIELARMMTELDHGATTAVMRLRTADGGWAPVHVTINRIELEPDTFAGLASVRLPTDAEVREAPFSTQAVRPSSPD